MAERKGLSRREFMGLMGLAAGALIGKDLLLQEKPSSYCSTCRNQEEGRCSSEYTTLTPSGVCGNYDPKRFWSIRYNNQLFGFGPKREGSDSRSRSLADPQTELTEALERAHPNDNADPYAVAA